ncbi:hypothetical protein PA25_35350 [Pseudoalteromonas sp. A25]|uniref:hypothetical protein n=1 Tax=Pseudoalteromonas sp. A25 TaxID=116092 RepID=UPI0012607578|nr:hypothetical protein [Pseudoalteromonas sp. A25]BBN83550.1 hypothetical protein PA25_35350 [Pseudoalteromonas sp. A25]
MAAATLSSTGADPSATVKKFNGTARSDDIPFAHFAQGKVGQFVECQGARLNVGWRCAYHNLQTPNAKKPDSFESGFL